jgi:hypothetical protein
MRHAGGSRRHIFYVRYRVIREVEAELVLGAWTRLAPPREAFCDVTTVVARADLSLLHLTALKMACCP